MAKMEYKSFTSYKTTYGISNPNGKDYARLDFVYRDKKVGQILFGSSIVPGTYAALSTTNEFDLYFPLSHFDNINRLLHQNSNLVLYLEVDDSGSQPTYISGGLTDVHPERFVPVQKAI